MSLLLDKIKKFPITPGCYLMKEDDHIIYIGKALNLKKRVLSYFQKKQDLKISSLLSKITAIEFIRTKTETEALILENNLIKEHQPFYNIQLKDDKRYSALLLRREPFPKLEITKDLLHKNVLGPYPGFPLKTLSEKISDFLQLRKCSLKEFEKRKKVCDYYHMDLCSGSCMSLESSDSYNQKIQLIKDFFLRKNNKLLHLAEETMLKKSQEEKYEEADQIKDLYLLLMKFSSEERFQSVENLQRKKSDLLFFLEKNFCSMIRIISLDQGKIVNKKDYFFLSSSLDLDSLVFLHYEQYLKPKVLYTNKKFLTHDISIQPFPASLKKVFSEQEFFLEKDLSYQLQIYNPHEALKSLQDILSLPIYPRIIESYDVAVFQGSSPTASQIVFKDGFSSPKDYRYYHLKVLPERNNDFKMLEEVFLRRLQKKPHPDLILIDGGLPQWRVLKKVQHFLNLKIPFITLAKEKNNLPDRLILNEKTTLTLKDSHLKYLLIQLRDEAHRFSRKLHHKKEQDRYFKK